MDVDVKILIEIYKMAKINEIKILMKSYY